jgi:endonuclease YncB( thermonuclease family)
MLAIALSTADIYTVTKITDGDRYGREIAVVYDSNTEINLELVKQGYAWHFARYCDDIRYYRAQKEAENAKLGLWGAANPIEPSEFRRLERKR